MNKLSIALISSVLSAFAGVPISRTVDVSATIKPISIESYAGETLDLSVQLASGGAPLATPSASATIYWQTNGMASAWWQTNMSCSASGLVTGSWSPGLTSGRVWFFVGVESYGLNYRVSGQCSILPSPGGAPSTAVLPPPGGTLNLGDYTVIGAPWITSSDSAAAIASATDPLASEISALSERAASAATSASNYTDSVAAPLIAATNSITARLDAIDIPDVSGFASKTSLQSASNSLADAVQQLSSDLISSTNELHTSLAPTISAASTALQPSATNSLLTSLAPTIQLASTALQPSASNALAQAIATVAQTVADNAQQSGYDLSAASNALSQAIATLAQTVADNAQQSGYDLSAVSNAMAQAISALSQTVSDNAQQSSSDLTSATNALLTSLAPTIQIASTALQPSATNGIPEEIASATNEILTSLAPTIATTSNALAQATADLAQKVEGLSMATATSNTAFRLMSLDGQIYQDATGTVWHTATAIGTSEWYVVSITYTNGTTVATNEIPGITSWSIYGGWRGDGAGGYDWGWGLHIPAEGIEYAIILGDASPTDMNLEFQLESGNISAVNFARTNTVTHYWSPVDHVLYSSSGGGGGGGSGLTTNDVCNIVTNEVTVEYTDWVVEDDWYGAVTDPIVLSNRYEQAEGYWQLFLASQGDIETVFNNYVAYGSENATRLVVTPYNEPDVGVGYVSRQSITQNALGLARLVDLPPLTNGLATASSLASLSSQLSQASQDATNYTDSATNDLARSFSVPDYANISNAAMNALSRAEAEAGFTEWKVTPPTYDNNPITIEWYDGDSAWHLAVGESAGEAKGSVVSTSLSWAEDEWIGGFPVTATRTRLPTMSDIPTNTTQLVNGSGYVTDSSVAEAISNADTTYTRFAISAPTNVNQSVQYINIEDENPSFLSVVIPQGSGTKDWIIYVNSRTNVTISLPAATWWMADVAYTNDIAPATPTALYFSQAADGIYTLGRQEFTEVVLP